MFWVCVRNKNYFFLPTDSGLTHCHTQSVLFMEFRNIKYIFTLTHLSSDNSRLSSSQGKIRNSSKKPSLLEACEVYKKGGHSRVLDLLCAAGEQSVVNLCRFKKKKKEKKLIDKNCCWDSWIEWVCWQFVSLLLGIIMFISSLGIQVVLHEYIYTFWYNFSL